MFACSLPDLVATRDLARRLKEDLAPGDVVLLDGPLGAGKTSLVKAVVKALGGNPTLVTSPTFTIQHQYESQQGDILHLDAYRLTGPADLAGLGFAEAAADKLVFIEWGERVAAEFASHDACWRLRLDHDGQAARSITIEAPPRCAPRWQADSAPLVSAAESEADPQPAVGVVTTIPADVNGQDPLTRAYAHEHRLTCAVRILSWSWFLLSLPVLVAAGAVAGWLHGAGPGVAAFADWRAFLIGVVGGAAVLALIGSARRMWKPAIMPVAQESWAAASLVAVVYLVLLDPLIGLGVVTGLLSIVYLAAIVFRLLALVLGGRRGFRSEELVAPEGGWPRYTVLVPLYREVDVARNILANLGKLDYPHDRLEVKFLLEADDPATLAALQAAGIPGYAEVLIVPHAQPKTKPRACNHGLQRATGEYLVIFDAEDRPEPDQLKQAVLAFMATSAQTACLQAQLAYRNSKQNLLTRWFAMEYNVWFRRYLPGLAKLGVPLPLGGTSNHFRTSVLRQLGGWDPFNVTEDCDLGVRLHLGGYRTALLDSTTWEEATSVVGNWIRQRSRWLKGYFVTHVVWARRPLWLLFKLRPWGVWGFLLTVLFVPVLAAINLVLWAYAGVYATLAAIDYAHGFTLWTILAERDYAAERLSWPMWFAGPSEDAVLGPVSQILFLASVVLFIGNFAFILIAGLAGRRPGQRGVWWAALAMPGYWFLISIAACKGLWQVVVKPHYWEKTIHGLDHSEDGEPETKT